MNYTPSHAPAPLKLSVVFGVFMLGLGACQPLVPPTTSPPIQNVGQTASQPAQAEDSAAIPSRQTTAQTPLSEENTAPEPNAESVNETITTAALATPIVVVPPKPPEITEFDPRTLVRKPVQDMTKILGEADFMRVEGQIGIWQFRQENCVVDFFFQTADADGDPARQLIIALDVRSRAIGQPLNEKVCRKELYQRRL